MQSHTDVDFESQVLRVLFVPFGASLDGLFMLLEAVLQTFDVFQHMLFFLIMAILPHSDGDDQ